MLIRVKCNYGLVKGGVTILKTPNDEPFLVSDAIAKNLISRGIAEEAESNLIHEANTEENKPLNKMNKAELVAMATGLGLDLPDGATKADLMILIGNHSKTNLQ